MASYASLALIARIHILFILLVQVAAKSVLSTSGFVYCPLTTNISQSTIVSNARFLYQPENRTIGIDLAGYNVDSQNITVSFETAAYGKPIFTASFNPCAADTYIEHMCPIRLGQFVVHGEYKLPNATADSIPAKAFTLPDLDAYVTMRLQSISRQQNIACIQSPVNNDFSVAHTAVQVTIIVVICVALVVTIVTAVWPLLTDKSTTGLGVLPAFGELMAWYHTLVINGMLSLQSPRIFSNFSRLFGFSFGLLSNVTLQKMLDRFRWSTGGRRNDTDTDVLRRMMPRSVDDHQMTVQKRATTLDDLYDVTPLVGLDSGIQSYGNTLHIPSSNLFMTMFLSTMVVLGFLLVLLLGFRLFLAGCSQRRKVPEKLNVCRTYYWRIMAQIVIGFLVIVYCPIVILSLHQLVRGDSWAGKVLAAVLFALLTCLFVHYFYRIWAVARNLKREKGHRRGLYTMEKYWVKYRVFYGAYRRPMWWTFSPWIVLMLLRGGAIVVTDSHGLEQLVLLIALESLWLVHLLWFRPYREADVNFLQGFLQVMRVAMIALLFSFVDQFSVQEKTKAIIGAVVIGVESLAIIVLVMFMGMKTVQHVIRLRRGETNVPVEEEEKGEPKKRSWVHRDTLTSLSPRNSLLRKYVRLDRPVTKTVDHSEQGKAPSYPPGLVLTAKIDNTRNLPENHILNRELPPLPPSAMTAETATTTRTPAPVATPLSTSASTSTLVSTGPPRPSRASRSTKASRAMARFPVGRSHAAGLSPIVSMGSAEQYSPVVKKRSTASPKSSLPPLRTNQLTLRVPDRSVSPWTGNSNFCPTDRPISPSSSHYSHASENVRSGPFSPGTVFSPERVNPLERSF